MLVHVTWDRKRVSAEILALNDDEEVLAQRDREWSQKIFPETEIEVAEEQPEAEKTPTKPAPRKKVKKPVEVLNTRTEASEVTHPYDQFLHEQKKRQLEWKSNRETKRAKVQSTTPQTSSGDNRRQAEDPVTLLRQQLAVKTEECCHNFVKVMFLQVVLIVPHVWQPAVVLHALP
ncbi:hypothetical protein OS493_036114 [Desmophyllum pertusum]|uniref:Uncharacterized protein n=1 Tax=Desmophyllum pertusum TaxID=174260 RepID=A0A9W9Y7F2_9CNID|nr:hypothetical protein OS493_036114 [Desmophyllum pertusum]